MLTNQHLSRIIANVDKSTFDKGDLKMIERFELFSLMISQISSNWHKIASVEMEKYGLKSTHSVYLMAMYRFPKGITATNLCELCGKDKADVSRNMSIMERKGLVIKEGEKNYRASFRLTDEGKNAAEAVRKRAILAVSLAGKELSEENRAILYTSLESISKNLKELSEKGLPENLED